MVAQIEATAAAISVQVGISPDRLVNILKDKIRFARAETRQDALQKAAQELIDKSSAGKVDETEARRTAQAAVNETKAEDRDLLLIKKPHRGPRIYAERVDIHSYPNAAGHVDNLSDDPNGFANMRKRALGENFNKTEILALCFLASDDAAKRSYRNITEKLGLTRRQIDDIKARMETLKKHHEEGNY